MVRIFPYVIPSVLAALGVPLWLRKVPPNRIYGIRTTKTFSSPQIWYDANEVGGLALIAAGVLALLANVAVTYFGKTWGDETVILICVAVDAVLMSLAVLFIVLQTARL